MASHLRPRYGSVFPLMAALVGAVTLSLSAVPLATFATTPRVGDTSTVNSLDVASVEVPAGSGSISGTVTDEVSALPLEGVIVATKFEDLNYVVRAVTATTAEDGTYTLEGLPEQWYLNLEFVDPINGHISKQVQIEHFDGEDLTGIDAALALGGTISGTIVDGGGNPLQGICAGFSQFGVGCSDASGHYRTEGLAAGTYSSISFRDETEAELYLTQSIDENVEVTVGADTSGIDAVMVRGGTFSGVVTDEVTGEPLEGVMVIVTPESEMWNSYSNGHVTNAAGEYRTQGLVSDSYGIEFYDPSGSHIGEWYDNTRWSSARMMPLTVGEDVTGVDAALQPTGIVTGRVTDRDTGEPVWACVSAVDGLSESQGMDCTDGAGVFSISLHETGSYNLWFDSDEYLATWYLDQPTQATATPVEVTVGQTTTGIDQTMVLGGTISGTVTDRSSGEPVDACVSAMDGPSEGLTTSCTDESGVYVIKGLATGSYKLEFSENENSGSYAGYVTTWYHDQETRDTATPVEVTAGQATTGIDQTMVAGGTIQGIVTDAVDGTAEGVVVEVYREGSFESEPEVGYSVTDDSGYYVVRGLPVGNYQVRFIDRWAKKYQETWYRDAATPEDATPVGVELATTTTVDQTLQRTGSISGFVTIARTGQPFDGWVRAYTAESSGWVSSADVIEGEYTTWGMTDGEYLLEFGGGSDLPSIWYDSQPTRDLATPVAVSFGANTPGIDQAIPDGGRISVTVTDETTGEPIPDADVRLFGADGAEYSPYSYSDGFSRVVLAGDYTIEVSRDGYVTEYYDNALDLADATIVNLDAGAEVVANVALAPARQAVAGSVTDAGTGEPLEGVCAYLYEQGTWNTVAASCTAEDGRIVMQDVPTGTYELAFADTAGTHHTQWYSGAASRDAATPITIETGTVITDANAAMAPITSVIGLVTDEQTGELLEGVCAYLYPVGSEDSVIGSCTEADGRIVMQGMAPGSYELAFADTTALHATEWFGDSATRDAAATIELAEGTIVTDAHAAMAPITTVVGHVTDAASGDPLAGVCAYLYPVGSETSAGASCTFDDGRIAIQGFPQGEYVIGFADTSGLRATEWYGGSYNRADATVIDLTTAWAGLDLDVAMDFTGSVTGLVTDDAGEPRADVCVYAGNIDGTYTGIGSCTDANGSFTLMGLNPVDVKLGYYPPGMGSPTTWWYDAQTSEETATPVTVPAGAVATLTTQAIPR